MLQLWATFQNLQFYEKKSLRLTAVRYCDLMMHIKVIKCSRKTGDTICQNLGNISYTHIDSAMKTVECWVHLIGENYKQIKSKKKNTSKPNNVIVLRNDKDDRGTDIYFIIYSH